MSFFDDDDEPPTAIRAPRASRPRSPAASARTHGPDRQQILLRRGIFALAVVVAIVVLVLVVAGCQSNAAKQGLVTYNTDVNKIILSSYTDVGAPFFADLKAAKTKNSIDVSVELHQLAILAAQDVTEANALSVPSNLTSAQSDLLLTLDLRQEAVNAVANLISPAMGSTGAQAAIAQIAGQMELILASDVIYSQRVSPLIAQALKEQGLTNPQVSARWLNDFAWLDSSTVATILTGVTGTGTSGQPLAPGTHGHALIGVSVGSTMLATGVVNHISAGANPTFAIQFKNSSANAATDVVVEAEVTALGKTIRGYATVPKTTPGQTLTVDVQLQGVPLMAPAVVTADIHKVPGEVNVLNNRGVYTAIFS